MIIERRLKHWIIEGFVIIALLAIFGPMLFAPQGKKNYIEPTEPPAFPDKSNYDKKIEVRPAAPVTLATKSPGKVSKPEAWVIQLGSFSIQSNADKMLALLKSEKLRVFTDGQLGNNDPVTRVYVGPEINHEKAESLLARLETELNLEGIIIPYNPLEL
jgi:DedD protein